MASYVGKITIGSNTYPVGSTLYGTCSGTVSGDATSYSVALANFDKLETGITIHVKFTIASGTATKLKVGSTPATSITNPSGKVNWAANSVISFTYDGTNWIMNDGKDTQYTAANTAPGKVASASVVGTSANYARQDHTHGIDLATGDSDGQVKIAGTNISVKGLADAAYKDVDTSISTNSTSTKLPTSAAVAALITSSISDSFAAADAMVFKGTLGTGGTITSVPTNKYSAGATYKIITAGTYAGIKCEIGDMLIAINDGPDSGTSVINADWTVVQTNIDGAVTGPTSVAADGNIALFNGTTGKIIKDSGIAFDGSTTNKWLTQKGTWTTPTPSQVGAAASNHTQAVNKGGTNITSYTKGDILYASAATTLARLGIGSANQVLKATTDGPAWSTPSISVTANTNGSVVTGVALNAGTQPSFTQGTLAKAEVADGTLTLTNQTGDTFSKGTYPSLGTISKANLGVSLS